MRRTLAVLFFCLTSLPAFAAPYSGIYFFGDSLTDVGNVQNVYAHVPHPPGWPATIPGAPYDSGGRATNGPNYSDVLAQGLGFVSAPSTAGGNNYAFGGARTRYQIFGQPFMGILSQIAAYTALPGAANSTALYVVWGGSNNLQDIIMGKSSDVFGNPIPNVAATVNDIVSGILALYAEGAREFLVPNAPDLGLTPRVSELGTAAKVAAHQLSLLYNGLLGAALSRLEASYAGLDIIGFDTYSLLNEVVTDPAAFGLSNTSDRCYTGDDSTFTGGGSVCANPDSYVFWDGIHPTKAVHAVLGNAMLAALQLQVPEPAIPALLGLALLAAIIVLRLNRRLPILTAS